MENLKNLTGNLYDLSHKKADWEHIPNVGFFGKILGDPDHWYKGVFEIPNFKIKVILEEWRHGMALNDYLDSMQIFYQKKKVYCSNIHRKNSIIQKNIEYCNDNEWIEQVGKLVFTLKKEEDKWTIEK